MMVRNELRAARQRLRRTQAEVAAEVGVTASMLSRWEVGTAPLPALDVVDRWATVLGHRLHVTLEPLDDPFAQLRQVLSADEGRAVLASFQALKRAQ